MSTSKIKWSKFFLFDGAEKYLVVVSVTLLLSAVLGAFTPHFIKSLSVNYNSLDLYYNTILYLGILFVSIYFNRVVYQVVIAKFVMSLVHHARMMCYEKWLLSYDVQKQNDNVREKYPQGEVLARIISDTESVRELLTSGTFGIIIDLFFVISLLISFVSQNLVAGTGLALAEISAALLLIWGSRYMRTIFMKVRKSRGQVYQTMANVVGGVSEMYYMDNGNYATKKGDVVFTDYLKKILQSNFWDASYYSLAESLYPLLLAFVVFIFPYSNITEAAVILVIVDLIQRSINPVKDISSKVANLQRAITGLHRIDEFIYDLDNGHSSPRDFDKEEIDFEKFELKIPHYKYPSRSKTESQFSLDNIEFTGTKGELLGIVGLSGCGKSTVLNIIAANIIPDNFELKLKRSCGEDIIFPAENIVDDLRYREQVGIVSQDSHIFSEPMFFNITMKQEMPDEFMSFWNWLVEKIPYLTHWGVRPTDRLDQKALSLGQKQLIAAIRSCYLKKTIVLFDEISSGLDSELEAALREVVLLIQKQSLTIIVAHRLETIIGADKIIVMDKGNLVGQGTHQYLVKNSQIYKQFIEELSHYSTN